MTLRVIQGGRRDGVRLGWVQVAVRSEADLPRVSAVVYEEDTFLTLSAPTSPSEPSEHPVRTFTDVLEAEPVAPGTVLIGPRDRPLALLAVVHDLDHDPSWRPDWIATALRGVIDLTARRQLGELALPLLGTVHGRMPLAEAMTLTAAALSSVERRFPERVWLVVPEPVREEVAALLSRLVGAEGGR
jgi:hypothetical protein